jgi:hypothetical protein
VALDFNNLPNNADVLRQMVVELALECVSFSGVTGLGRWRHMYSGRDGALQHDSRIAY